MIEYRNYNKDDEISYLKFCERNFGKNCYQSDAVHLRWLLKYNNDGFFIMLDDDMVVGCIHSFQAFIMDGVNIILSAVIHDLMVDEKFRSSGGGLKLIQHGLKSRDFTILSGSIGKLARVYNRMCPIQIESQWYKKIMLPRNIFFKNRVFNLGKYRKRAEKNDFVILCNEVDGEFIKAHSFEKYNINEKIENFLYWRFLDKGAPQTFLISDSDNTNSVMFVFSKKGIIPYLRIFDIIKEKDEVIVDIIKFIEEIAASMGILVILYTVLKYNFAKNMGYKQYNPMPTSYIYTKNRGSIGNKTYSVPGYCSDLGFDAHKLKFNIVN